MLGQTAGALVGSMLINDIPLGFSLGALGFGLVGIIVVGIWPREASNLDEQRVPLNLRNVLRAFVPPHGKGSGNFYYALLGRMMMVAGYQMITGYQLYIVKYYVFSDLRLGRGWTVGGGRRRDRRDVRDHDGGLAVGRAGLRSDLRPAGHAQDPVALASCLFAVGAADAVDPAQPDGHVPVRGLSPASATAPTTRLTRRLSVSILPNPKEAGKDLGVLNMANTLSSVIGSA